MPAYDFPKSFPLFSPDGDRRMIIGRGTALRFLCTGILEQCRSFLVAPRP